MHINNPEKRLAKFWGRVDKKHIRSIAEFVKGECILDVGCGMGTTTGALNTASVKCIGIDYDDKSLNVAKSLNPNGIFMNENCEKLSFSDNYFDTIILRDVLHHLTGESDFSKSKKELIRVAKPGARIIILDPNINFILKFARKIASHKDEECTYEEALKIVESMNGVVIHKNFHTIYSLPLSGGYVGTSFIPNINFIQNLILLSEKKVEKIINKLNMGRSFCWRYLIAADILK